MFVASRRELRNAVLTCFDSFKGTLTASDACLAIERAFCNIRKDVFARTHFEHCPMSDGGAGLLESLLFPYHTSLSSFYKLTRVEVPAGTTVNAAKLASPFFFGPLGEPLNYVGNNALPYFACDVAKCVVVVEMAVVSGLPLVPEALRNPLHTTSYGVGQLIRYAVEYVAKEHSRLKGPHADCGVTVFLGIGGSATNDGGLGALQALGLELLVANNGKTHGESADALPLATFFTGGDLERLVGVRLLPEFRQMFFSQAGGSTKLPYCKEIRIIGDVESPLIGPHGATYVFGPQKCSSLWDAAQRERVLSRLERGMSHAASVIVQSGLFDEYANSGDKMNVNDSFFALCSSSGGGGAGGMAGFFTYMLKALWMPGADVVAELLGLPEKLQRCDYVITGEGSFDEQTLRCNKTVGRVLQMVVMENLRRCGVDSRLIGDVIIVSGRTSYTDSEEVRSLLRDCMLQKVHCDVNVLVTAIPQIHLLPLTPQHFSVEEAMVNAGTCVYERMRRFLAVEETNATDEAFSKYKTE